jgi:hypothetical protein
VLNPALDHDAKLSSHPIEAEVPDEGRIAQVTYKLIRCTFLLTDIEGI